MTNWQKKATNFPCLSAFFRMVRNLRKDISKPEREGGTETPKRLRETPREGVSKTLKRTN